MVAELVEWRLHDYFLRGAGQLSQTGNIVLRVRTPAVAQLFASIERRPFRLPKAQSSSQPKARHMSADSSRLRLTQRPNRKAKATRAGALLRGWFGPAAGHPGTDHRVVLREDGDGWSLAPAGRSVDDANQHIDPVFPELRSRMRRVRRLPVPSDIAPRRQSIAGLPDVDPDEFVVRVRGESMAGGATELHHGDLVRMRWTRRRTPDELVGRPVLVELAEDGERRPALKVLDRDADGFILRSTADLYEDIRATGQMTVVGELVDRVDAAAWNPLERWVGQDFRREPCPRVFGEEFNFGKWGQSGHVTLEDDSVLFVTLDKEAGRSGSDYLDYFESADLFHWTSQSTTAPEGKKGREVLDVLDTGRRFHLFARRRRQDVSFVYCGALVPTRHEGAKPMLVWFRLFTPLDRDLQRRFAVAESE